MPILIISLTLAGLLIALSYTEHISYIEDVTALRVLGSIVLLLVSLSVLINGFQVLNSEYKTGFDYVKYNVTSPSLGTCCEQQIFNSTITYQYKTYKNNDSRVFGVIGILISLYFMWTVYLIRKPNN